MTPIIKIAPLGLIFTLFSALAEAEPTCESLNRLSASLASYRELQVDKMRQPSPERLVLLSEQLNAMAADPMFQAPPSQPAGDMAALTVRTYLGNFQSAVGALRQGADRTVLDTVIPPAFGPAFMALQQRVRCPEPEPATDSRLMRNLAGLAGRGQEDPSAKPEPGTAASRSEPGKARAGAGRPRALAASPNADPERSGVRWQLLLGLGALACVAMALVSHHNTRQRRRRSHRPFVNLETSVLLGGYTVPMTIVDITPSGVKLRHRGQIGSRRRLKISLLGGWRTGKVRWKNVAFAGVSFSRHLSVSEVERLVESTKAIARPAPDTARPGKRERFAPAGSSA